MFFRGELRGCALSGRLLSGSDFRRKPLKRPAVRDAPVQRVIGTHGLYRIIEVRSRGKPSLRYVRA